MIVKSLGSDIVEYIFDEHICKAKTNVAGKVEKFIKQSNENGSIREALELSVLHQPEQGTSPSFGDALKTTKGFMEKERRISLAFQLYRKKFPSTIWTCCQACCFATVTIVSDKFLVFDEVMRIHEQAEKHHKEIETVSMVIDKRRKGVGTSNLAFASVSRSEREALPEEEEGTQQKLASRRLEDFVFEVLPFLRGQGRAPSGIDIPDNKLCTEAIRCFLSISRNFLYYRRKNVKHRASDDELLDCLVDNTGLRLRRCRVLKDRGGFSPIEHLNTFDCGCDVPCLQRYRKCNYSPSMKNFLSSPKNSSPVTRKTSFCCGTRGARVVGQADARVASSGRCARMGWQGTRRDRIGLVAVEQLGGLTV